MKLVSRGFVSPLVLALALGLGGCANVDVSTFRTPDFVNNLRLPSMAAPVVVDVQKPVSAEDLIDGEGRCASAPLASAVPEAAGTDPVTTPTNPSVAIGGIALGMTECDVVKRAGPPEKVAIATNERAERTLTLTYQRSVRSGIYNFTAGRLVSIERVDEPPPPPKPAKPAKTAKPKPKLKPAPT